MGPALVLLFAASSTLVVGGALAEVLRGAVVLESVSGVRGRLVLRQEAEGGTSIEGTIEGLAPGLHGFHIHEKGDLSQGCTSAGNHYNPHNLQHGGPENSNRHVGDLGNVEAGPDGVARVRITDDQVQLSGPHSVLGRAVVVHSDQDDLGRGGFPDSLTTGHAGSRVACGVIGVMDPVDWDSSSSSATAHWMPLVLLSMLLITLLLH